MPEAPEVKTLSDYLNIHLKNHRVISCIIHPNSRYHKGGLIPGMNYFEPFMEIIGVSSRGKKIIFMMQNHNKYIVCLISFLGMEGRWCYEKGNHSGIELGMISPEGKNYSLYFDDSRHFGLLNFVATIDEYNDVFKNIGPDLLNDNVTLDMYREKIRNKRIRTKEIGIYLLEQKYFSGIGNYLRSEILYHAKISPFRSLENLSDSDVMILYQSIIIILNESYKSGGLTISTYRLPNNQPGRYTPLIYGLSKTNEGYNVIVEKMKDTRSVHWCQEVQK